MLKKVGTFKITDESLDRHSERVLVSGIDLENFKANPILLYNHHRARSWDDGESKKILPIGRWDNIVKTGEAVYADAYIDTEDELGAEVARKVELGILQAASIGFRAYAWSDEDADKVVGQKGYTITSSEIREVSIVDIPSNPNALISAKMAIKSLDEDTTKEKNNFDLYRRGSLVTKQAPKPKEEEAINKNSKSKITDMFKDSVIKFLNENFGTSFKTTDSDEDLAKGVNDLPTVESITNKAIEEKEAQMKKDITESINGDQEKKINDLQKSFEDKLTAMQKSLDTLKGSQETDEEKAARIEKEKTAEAAKETAIEKQIKDLQKQLAEHKGDSTEPDTNGKTAGGDSIKGVINGIADMEVEFAFETYEEDGK